MGMVEEGREDIIPLSQHVAFSGKQAWLSQHNSSAGAAESMRVMAVVMVLVWQVCEVSLLCFHRGDYLGNQQSADWGKGTGTVTMRQSLSHPHFVCVTPSHFLCYEATRGSQVGVTAGRGHG